MTSVDKRLHVELMAIYLRTRKNLTHSFIFIKGLPFANMIAHIVARMMCLIVFSVAQTSCKQTSKRPVPAERTATDAALSPDVELERTAKQAPSSSICLTMAPYPGTDALSPAYTALALVSDEPSDDPSRSEVGLSTQTQNGTDTCARSAASLESGSSVTFEQLAIENTPSPNYSARGETPITGIVVHNTTGQFNGARSWLRNPNAKVSAHIIIGRNGQISRLVDDENAAWHAIQMNKSTLGVELEAWLPEQDITLQQEQILKSVLSYWMNKYSISRERITSHRTHVDTACPSLLWSREVDFLNWRNGLVLH